jgi:predicted nucleotidyltransferase
MKQFGLKPEQIDALSRCFAKYPAIEQVILYGSRAKGNFKDGSDIDLTIIDSDMTFSELLQLENMLDDLLLPYKIDLSLKRQISNAELVDHIERAGKLFYERQV